MRYPPRVAFGRWGENPQLDAMRVRALLETITQINVAILSSNPHLPGLYESGVRYAFKPHGGEEDDPWCDVLAVLEQSYGDCEDLCMYRAAELRARHGVHAECDFEITRRNGRDEIHIFVRIPGRPIEDPSRALGMQG